MADQLATPESLASLLQQDLDASTANLVIEAATAAVQAAVGGQRLIEVEDDEFVMMGNLSVWLVLPQRPVSAVDDLTIDGSAIAFGGDCKWIAGMDRIWRRCGWQTCRDTPSEIGGVYSHGYPDGAQDLELARGATLSIAKAMYANPAGVASEKIDDYAVSFAKAVDEASAQLDASPFLGRALRKMYGQRAGLVRIG